MEKERSSQAEAICDEKRDVIWSYNSSQHDRKNEMTTETTVGTWSGDDGKALDVMAEHFIEDSESRCAIADNDVREQKINLKFNNKYNNKQMTKLKK